MTREPTEEKLCEFMAPFSYDECTREVIQLLGRHPHTKLSQVAIRLAIDWRKFDVDRSLGILVNKRLVKTHRQNGQSLYSLTNDEPQNGLAQKIAALDLAQWRAVLKKASLPPSKPLPYRSLLSQREQDILLAARHQSAFVLPVMPRF